MKSKLCTLTLVGWFVLNSAALYCQTSSVVIPSNRSTGTLEKNVLFYAGKRYSVTQQGSATLSLPTLFDGRFHPTTTTVGPSETDPTVILIENLPQKHTQAGAWVGWSSRAWRPVKFKIEVYNTWQGANPNQWITIADVDNYALWEYMIKLPSVIANKLRFTFYKGSGTNGRFQLSELFFIHPEAIKAYDGLMVKYNADGNVGIGTATPQAKLAVDGNILAKEIKVKTDITIPDYVFEDTYQLPLLSEVESYIREHKHLPEIPSAAEINKDGLKLAEMNLLLLKKVEELTLYLVAQDKITRSILVKADSLEAENFDLRKRVEALESLLNDESLRIR